jgi:enoyl-CoA hydratase
VPLVDCGTLRLPRIVGHGRAMDLILTGRAVEAPEALAMGLVNRVVPIGSARSAAEELARELAAFPQTAMRGDRLSAIEQWDLERADAVANELAHGRLALEEAAAGASQFEKGAGRHGRFDGNPTRSDGPARRKGGANESE